MHDLKIASTLILLSTVCAISPAHGQEEAEPSPPVEAKDASDSTEFEKEQDFSLTERLAEEDWALRWGIDVTRMFDNNVFAQDTNTTSDWVTIVSPGFSLASDWDTHELSFSGGFAIAEYDSQHDERYIDGYIRAGGFLELSEDHSLFGSLDFQRDHESRTDPDFPGGAAEPVVYYDFGGVVGLDHRLDNYRLRYGLTGRRLDFDDVDRTIPGILNNDDRDRYELDFGGRLSYIEGEWFHPFIQASLNQRIYDDRLDDFGFERDSYGHNIAVGSQVRLSRNAFAEGFIGYMGQDYKDGAFDTVHDLEAGARLNAQLTERTRVDLSLDRSIEETTIVGSPASVDSNFFAELTHRLTSDLTVGVPAYYQKSDFQDIGRTDDNFGVGVNFNYRITSNLYLEVGYNYARRDSSLETADYENETIYVSIGKSMFDADAPQLIDFDEDQSWPENIGLYGGAQAGIETLITNVTGPRGAGGTVDNEQGDLGGTLGGFVGVSTMLDRWLVAGELEIDETSANWLHGGTVDRIYESERNRSLGASLRLGYLVNEAAIPYLRLGLVNTQFESQLNNGGAITEQTHSETGLQYGVGFEVELDQKWLARMDWTYRMYDDYTLSTDTYDPNISLVRFGLVYRFGGAATEQIKQEAAVDHDINGIYHAIGLGHSTLLTNNVGQGRGSAEDETLVVDRAGDGGNISLITGYGGRICDDWPIYLGAEGFVEFSNSEWNIKREPSRRDYSLQKKYALGGLVRLGYLIENTALFYVQGGPVWGNFDLDYNFPAATDGPIDIDRNFTDLGIRFGGGIEVPVSDRMFLRLDYTYTDYGTRSFSIPSGDERFETAESLVWLGLGYRY